MLIQLLDEFHSGAGGKLRGASDQDILLETLMAGLPISASRLSKEETLDYGSILEALRKLFTQREQRLTFSSQAICPIKNGKCKDVLTMIWEGFQQANESGKQRIALTFGKAFLKVPEKFEKEIVSGPIKQVKDFKGVNVSFVEY